MAAILDVEKNLNLENLAQEMAKVLPQYARPLFVRIVETMDLTGTYKLRKVDYQKEAFDVEHIKDAIYFLDSKSQTYIKFTVELHEQLHSGKIRV